MSLVLLTNSGYKKVKAGDSILVNLSGYENTAHIVLRVNGCGTVWIKYIDSGYQHQNQTVYPKEITHLNNEVVQQICYST